MTNGIFLLTGGEKLQMNENVFLDFSQHIHILVIRMKQMRAYGIIHIFAALHAVTTVTCRLVGMNDELLLTLLTMFMVVLVCLRKKLTLEFTAAIVILVNVIGYVLGIKCADIIGRIFSSAVAVHAISTFITTELIGWGALWSGSVLRRFQRGEDEVWAPRMTWLVVTVVAIFLFRLSILALGRLDIFTDGMMYDMLLTLLSNLPAIIILLCVNMIYVRFARNAYGRTSRSGRMLSLTLFILVCVLIGTFLVGYGLPFSFGRIAEWQGMLSLAVVVLMTEVVIYVVVYMLDFLWTSRQALKAEKMKRHKAQFEYMKLKQQVDPHFLFNSLNVLDCLVVEEKTAEASTFIHKLAGMYRYMLKNEGSMTIGLREEMDFVNMYADLMKVRFQSGFLLNVDIPSGLMGRCVVPCSLQMLVENALKHNAALPADPLVIDIAASGNCVRVRNALRPRATGSSGDNSTRVGLNYIRQQYLDLAGRDIEIEEGDGSYSVTLPLLY